MGGRGSSSMSNTGQPIPDAEWNARAAEYLDNAIETLANHESAGAAQLKATAEAARGLVGTEKLEKMRYDDDITRINFFLRDWSHPYTGYGSLGTLNDALTGYNQPLGSEDTEWARFGDLVRSANSKGFSNEEIAGLLRFDQTLIQYW